MLKLYPLFSSSSGNMYLIESHKTCILVDIGVSYKKCKNALLSVGKDIADVSAIFITHEHSDHVKGLEMLVKHTDIPVYASPKTTNYLSEIIGIDADSSRISNIVTSKPCIIQDITVTSFDTSHDAIEPVGYKIDNSDSSITIATDLGVMTDNVFDKLNSSTLSVIEANYDTNTLWAGSYPFSLKRRILSPIGHLSNEDSGQAILKLAENGKRDFLLAHLSENNNMPCIARETILSNLSMSGFNISEFNINIASKELSNEVYIV